MREEILPEDYIKGAYSLGIVKIQLLTGLYLYPFVEIEDEYGVNNTIIENINVVVDDYKYRNHPTALHYLQWANRLERYAKWCMEKADNLKRRNMEGD